MADSRFISVAVLAPLDAPLTYTVPGETLHKIRPGLRVLVPLGRRRSVGIVLGKEESPPGLDCKPIESVLEEEPTFTSSQLEFIQWAADYYLAPLGEVFRTALPNALTREGRVGIRSQGSGVRSGKSPPNNVADPPLTEEAGRQKTEAENSTLEIRHSTFQLTESQKKIVESVIDSSKESAFAVHLVHGVTGSGKTEVYLASIEEVLKKGKQAIALVPEIGLTPQTVRRYTEHFGDRVGVFHSALSERERLQTWNSCQKGEISILIGTRSALFAPFRALGLIVVDEEQDNSYKQEERVRYHARDLAIVRGKIEKIPVLLGSATPSVETYSKARNGKFFYHELKERFGNAELPKVEIVDLRWEREEGEKRNATVNETKNPIVTAGKFFAPSQESINKKKFFLFSPRLLEEMALNLERKEQTLIFLNRRGFSHFLLCEDCGATPECPNCDITLTFHRGTKKLLCHYCDHQISPPELCPNCRGLDWRPVGSGTERIEEELKEQFPEARVVRMDRDTTSRKGSHEKILEKLNRREIDILIGTQMIAKGHDYPLVTLVGILLADTALHHPDFRASESTFQLITQVAGRAGRAEHPGRVILQTFSPENDSIDGAANHRIREFYERELNHREELGYPPFQRLLVFRIQGTNSAKVQQGAEKLKNQLERLQKDYKLDLEILGPAPCLVARLRNYYRWQILLKIPAGKSLQPLLKRQILGSLKDWLPAGLRLIVDVDPAHVV